MYYDARMSSGLRCDVRDRRLRAGLQQQELAQQVGISRQSLSSVEAGETVPSTTVALALARALDCRVEDLFELPDARLRVAFAPALGAPLPPVEPGGRLRVGLVRDRWIAHRLDGDAPSVAATPADALVAGRRSGAAVVPLRDVGALRANLLVAGCDPAIGLLAGHLADSAGRVRLHWIEAASGAALDALAFGMVHVAGLHLYDPASGQHNLPAVHARLGDRPVVLVTLATWEQGLVVRPASARRIRRLEHVAARGVRVVLREAGAGARVLLERLLGEARIPIARLTVVDTAYSHHAVAHTLAAGTADVGVATAAAAAAYGLTFIPLAEDRFDLVMPAEVLRSASGARMVDTLSTGRFRRDIGALRGYGTAETGKRLAA
jgi:molybdate-binding protein/DNA-binding XRE family transcriptional regulator